MKDGRMIGLLAVLILGCLLVGGCTNTGSTSTAPVATVTPQTVYVTVTPVPVQKNVLFSDDLSRPRSEWGSEDFGSGGKIFYSGGSLHIRDNDPPRMKVYHTLNKNFDDFILDVDIKTVDGSIDNWQGVDVRSQGDEDYYYLSISADGYYTIGKVVNNNLESLIGQPTRSGYINTGIGETNHIQIVADKNTLSYSVNGHLLRTVTDNTFREGVVELTASCLTSNSFTEVAFNNLVITSP